MLADIKTRTKARAKSKTKWNACTREHSYLKKPVPLPATWGASVDTFLAAGLPVCACWRRVSSAPQSCGKSPAPTCSGTCAGSPGVA